MSQKPFVSRDFRVSQQLKTERFYLRMLKISDVVKGCDELKTSLTINQYLIEMVSPV